jgi:PAS domain S-box-containing protein
MTDVNHLSVPLDFLEHIETPVFVKNQQGVYIFCNVAFSKFLGVGKNKILGHTAFDIAPVALANLYTSADKELFESSQRQTYSAEVVAAKSNKRGVIFTKSVIYTEADEVGGFIGSIQLQPEVNVNFDSLRLLSRGERAVLDLLFVGHSVKAIAKQLSLSPHTIMGYTKSIYAKLGVHSKNEALYKALTLVSQMTNR